MANKNLSTLFQSLRETKEINKFLSSIARDFYNGNKENAELFRPSIIEDVSKLSNVSKDAKKNLSDFLQTAELSGNMMGQYREHLKKTTTETSNLSKISLKANSIVTNLVKDFGKSLASAGIGMVTDAIMGAATNLFTSLNEKERKEAENAENMANSLRNSQASMAQGYDEIGMLAARYNELSQGVSNMGQNISLTDSQYEEYKQTVGELSELMPTLNTLFNEQGEKIGFAGGKLQDATKEYQKYIQTSAQGYLRKGDEKGNTYQDVLEDFDNSNDDHTYGFQNHWRDTVNRLITNSNIYGWMFSTRQRVLNHGNHADFGSELFGAEDEFSEREQLNILNKLQNSKKEDWSEILGDVRMGDSKKANLIEDMFDIDVDKVDSMDSDEYEHLQEMVTQKISGLNQTLEGKAKNVTSGMSNMLLADDDYWAIEDEGTRNALSASLTGMNYDVLTGLGIDLTNQIEVETWVAGIVDKIKENKGGVANAFKSLFSMDADALDPATAKKQADGYIKTIADTLYDGKATDEQIDHLKKSYGFNQVDTNYDNYKKQLNESFNVTKRVRGENVYNSERETELLSWAESHNVQEQELKRLKDKGFSEKTSIGDLNAGLQELRKPPSQENGKLFDQAWKDTQKKDKEKLLKYANAGKLTPEVLASNEKYAAILKSVGGNAELASQKINAMVNKSTQLKTMRKGINTISDAYSEKENAKDNRVSEKTLNSMYSALDVESWDESDLDVWKRYKEAAEDANTPLAGLKSAQDDLATSFINSNNFLSQLDETNQDFYDDMLTDMGITNAHAITTDILNKKVESLSLMKQIAKKEGKDLSDVTLDEILNQNEYLSATEDAKNGLLDLYLQERILNNSKLNMSQKISALKDFIKELDEAKFKEINAKGDEIFNDTIRSELAKSNGMGISEATKKAQKEKEKYLAKEAKKITGANQKTDTSGSRGKSGDKGNSGNKNNQSNRNIATDEPKPVKEPKQEINWMDRKITVLNNKLSETQKRYDAIAASMKKIDSSAMVRKENANLEKQIRILKKLRSTYGRQESKYQSRANNYVKKNFKGKSNEKLRSNIKNGKIKGSYSSLVKKYGQEKANKIQTAIDLYDKASTARQNKVDASKQIRDNEIQQHQNRADLTQKKIDKYAARAELVHLSKKNKYIDNEITQTKKLYSHQIDIAKLNRDNEEVAKLEAEQKKKIRDLEIEKLQNLADEGEESYNLYKTQASMTTNHKDRNKLAKNVTDSLRKQYSNLIKIADEEGNIAEKNRLQLELQQKLNEESKERIQNVSEDYENRLIGNSRQMQVWNNAASLAEAKGKTVNAKFYDQMASVAGQEEKKRKNEVDDAWNTYYEQMRDNPNFINSQEWYDAIQIINDASDAYEQAQINAEQYKQKAIEANWAIADSAKQAIDHLNSEAEAYKSIFGYKDMYDKDGRLTDAGTATFALNVYGIENSTDRIGKINEEIDALTEQYKAGDISIEKYNERMQELRDDALNTAESIYSLRDGMKSLIEEGLNAEMDALNESIDKVKQNLSDASNLREYQKNIEKQTKNIASLERQISAKSGDMSEKGRADLQKLKVQLEDAKSELEDTEYDKYIEDQERILDDMAEDFQNHIDAQLKDVNNLLQGIIDSIGKGEPSISKILQDLSKEIGVDLSKVLSENLDLFATTGKTNAGDVYDNTVKDYNNSANAEYKNGENTKVMNTDDKKGTVETNGQASDPAYQKTSAWLKSKGFSDKDIETMYGSLDNAQKIFSGIQNAGGNASARDIFKTYQKGNVDASKGFSKFEETDAYANEINELLNLANEKKAEIKEKENLEEKNKRKTNNNNKVMKIAEIFSTVRPYANNKEQETAYEYGSQMYANEHGKKYNKYLSLKNAKKIDELVKELVNVDTGKPMFDTSNPNKIKKAIETLDKQYDGVLKSSIKNRMPTWSIGGFSKGGVIDSKTMATIAESNGDDAWVTVKSGEGILSPADTQNLFALTDAFGKLDNQRPLSTWNLVPRNNAAPSNNVYGGLNIHLDGSDIHDFASFEAAFQNATRKSPKLRNTILDVATSGMTGDANAYMRR